MQPRERRAFATSLVAHALLVAGVAVYVHKHPRVLAADAPVGTIEIAFEIAPLRTAPTPRHDDTVAQVTLEPVAVQQASNEAAHGPEPQQRARVITAAGSTHTTTEVEPLATPHETTNGAPSMPATQAFVGWDPRAAANSTNTPRTAAPLHGTEILANADDAADRAARAGALADAPSNGHTDHGETGTGHVDTDQVQQASAGYLRDAVENAAPTNIPGALPYYRRVAREATRVFHPPFVPTPTLAETVVNTFVTSEATAMDATRRSLGPLAEGRAGHIAELQQFAHPNSPLLQPANTMAARAAATARTTQVEIEVDQDSTGRIIATRLRTHSGVSGFDRDALRAIQDAVRGIDPPAITGGVWRSRWSFAVTTSRDPLISALPGLPGDAPGFGVTGEVEFDEVTHEAEFHLPGMTHSRRRVRLMSSRIVPPPTQNTASNHAH